MCMCVFRESLMNVRVLLSIAVCVCVWENTSFIIV